MAQVPVSTTPKVDQRALPTTAPQPLSYQSARGVTADSFGAQVGRSLIEGGQKLGAAADDAYRQVLKEQIEDNERKAKELDIAFASFNQTIGFGDGSDENKGFYGTKGENTLARQAEVTEAIKKERQRLLDSAPNKAVKDMFGLASAVREKDEIGRVLRYTGEQRTVANNETSEARITTATSDAALNYNDDDTVVKSLAVVEGEVLMLAERNGMGKETTDNKLRLGRTQVVTGAVEAAVRQEDPARAEKLLSTYEGMIDGVQAAKLRKSVEDGSVTKAAQILRDQALAKFPNDPVAGREWIKSVAEGKTEDEALSRFNNELNAARQVKNDAQSDAANARAITTFNQGQTDRAARLIRDAEADATAAANREWTLAERARTERVRAAETTAEQWIESKKPYTELPFEVRELLPEAAKKAFQAREVQLASGEPNQSDWTAYAQYNEMNADQLRNLNMAEVRTKLADDEFNIIRNRYTAALQGRIDKDNPTSIPFMINAKIEKIGLKTKPGSSDDKEAGQIRTMVTQEIERAEKANGNKRLTTVEIQEIIDGVTDPVAIQRTTVLGMGIVPGEKRLSEIEVPKTDRDQITAEYRKKGRVPTEADIVRQYLKVKVNKGKQ